MALLSLNKRRAVSLAWLVLLAAAISVADWIRAASPRLRGTESEIKSTYIYNFALFTRWPERAFADANSPLVIGIVGEDPFGGDLDKLAAAKKVGSRPLKLVRAPAGSAPPECHILFIAITEKSRVRELIAGVKGRPVLTVSDVEPFCTLGGCIRFARTDKSVDLFFNPKAALGQGLVLSPELLAIGKIRETAKDVEPK